ncbi:MAG TPA: flippase activity-associated protein Agl23 [Terrimicrobiaceae bacterium]
MTGRLKTLPWIEIGILTLAAALRLVLLDIKPPHFDEGVNGWFADQMTRNGYFRYDPTNYHGPLHFYAVFLSQTLFGRNLWALRLPAVAVSLLAVWSMLRFREHFGASVARIAALAMAVSPACVFYGRYSIHESWMVLFSTLFLWGALGLWQKGERRFLFALFVAASGMILTKETYVLHIGSFFLAGLVLWLLQKLLPSHPNVPIARQQWTGKDLATGGAAAIFAILFFYSGTFLDFQALSGLYETFAAWLHTGIEAGGHEKKTHQIGPLNYYWVALMARYEWPALLGLTLSLRYIAPSDARLRYLAIYGCGVLVAYSLIPYKTPWCIISIIWPFYLILGSEMVAATAQTVSRLVSLLLRFVAAISIATSVFLCVRLNFFRFTNEKEPFVYVQTYSEIETLTKPLLEMARQDPRYYHLRGQILLDSYYPLPWMLGDFTQIGYFKKEESPESYDADFVVAEKNDVEKIESALADQYYKRTFRLRDSQEECVVYFRRKTFESWFKGAPPLVEGKP